MYVTLPPTCLPLQLFICVCTRVCAHACGRVERTEVTLGVCLSCSLNYSIFESASLSECKIHQLARLARLTIPSLRNCPSSLGRGSQVRVAAPGSVWVLGLELSRPSCWHGKPVAGCHPLPPCFHYGLPA